MFNPEYMQKFHSAHAERPVSDLVEAGHLAFFKAQDHPFNKKHFCGYFMEAFEQFLSSGIHKNNCQRVKYLPLYSPFLNQIENLLSKWKNIVKTASPRSETDLLSLIESSSIEIMPSDCDGHYQNMLKYNRRSKGVREEINE
ncbi:hypothetical protein RF11_11826 [Thelohanellus kitauei]|uniref:Tc1-like transposase DDE domain-containing protein n=1 Tax=Thelohanellus kitauei TaxID=669202 RepID=A0A0C2N292_THEKT|nr:hypothetical protein RF11_11826 [Thelohanellus kitauei]